MYKIGRAFLSKKAILSLDAVWFEEEAYRRTYYIAVKGCKIPISNDLYVASMESILKDIEETKEQLLRDASTDDLGERVLNLEKRINEIYHAPGMPGFLDAIESFQNSLVKN